MKIHGSDGTDTFKSLYDIGSVTLDGNNTFTGVNTFNKHISLQFGPEGYVDFGNGLKFYGDHLTKTANSTQSYYLLFPSNKTGSHTLATTSDIPDVATFAKLSGDNTFTGTNTFAYNSIKINNKYHGTNGASWATTIQGWDPTGGGNNNFILTLPKTSGTITVGVKVNGTIHAADSSGLVDLGTISGGSSGPIKTATLSGTTLSITLS